MDVFGLKRMLERLVGKVITSEIVTDASTTVLALVRKMKGEFMVGCERIGRQGSGKRTIFNVQ